MKRGYQICLGVALLMIGIPLETQSQNTLSETQAKLAIIHNFVGRYTQWPGRYSLAHVGEIYVCSFGDDDVVKDFELLEAASTERLKLFTVSNAKLSMAHECHVMYIAASEKWRMKQLLEAVAQYPVLTISPIAHFSKNGGMVELMTSKRRQGNFEKNYVRYTINLGILNARKIMLEPDAVELAKEVVR